MKKIIILLTIASTILFAFIIQQYQTQERTQPFAVVNIGNIAWIEAVQQKIEPKINAIIKNELYKINTHVTEFPTFQIKKRHHVTLYYSKKVPTQLETFIKELCTKTTFSNLSCLQQITFTNEFKFFGINKDELVVIIQDQENCLKYIRQQIIQLLSQKYKFFEKQDLHKLLATQKHNIFEFVPHDSLGRLPMQQIIELSNQKTFENIKSRILQEIPQILQNINISNNVNFKELIIVDHNVKPLLVIPV